MSKSLKHKAESALSAGAISGISTLRSIMTIRRGKYEGYYVSSAIEASEGSLTRPFGSGTLLPIWIRPKRLGKR